MQSSGSGKRQDGGPEQAVALLVSQIERERTSRLKKRVTGLELDKVAVMTEIVVMRFCMKISYVVGAEDCACETDFPGSGCRWQWDLAEEGSRKIEGS